MIKCISWLINVTGIESITIFCWENAGSFNVQESGIYSGYCTDGLESVSL